MGAKLGKEWNKATGTENFYNFAVGFQHQSVMTKYPIGIQSFQKLRESGFLYVDKTVLVHRLVSTEGYYFLSRPRRFGKSLLLSTLEAYFQGKKELFKGLALEQLEKDWKVYPVFHM